MKKNNYLSALTALIFSVQVCAYVPMPPPPDYKNCPIVQASVVTTNPDGSTKTEMRPEVDQSCVQNADRQYRAMQTANAMANNIIVDSNNGVMAPVKPIIATCTDDGAGNLDYACLNNKASKERAYDQQLSIYNKFKEEEARSASQQQSNIDARSRGSATEHLATAEAQALSGQKDQSAVSGIAMGASITLAGFFAASCMGAGATCQYKFAIGSAAAALLSMMTAKQANEDQRMAFDACKSYNQMASQAKECGAPPPPFDPDHMSLLSAPPFPYGQVDPVTGKCLPSASPTCQKDLTKFNEGGKDIRPFLAKGPSAFAGPNGPFKLNKDGTVTMKNGKTYKLEDFASQESMIAAGISPSEAKAVASNLYGKDGVYAKAGLDPKADLAAFPKSLESFDMGAGGSTTVNGATDDREKLGLGSKDVIGSASRKPTATDVDGLVRNFNGDSIGISNDNIFKMMNKRYILKSAQDSFIGQ